MFIIMKNSYWEVDYFEFGREEIEMLYENKIKNIILHCENNDDARLFIDNNIDILKESL